MHISDSIHATSLTALKSHMQATLAAYDIAANFPSLTVSCYTFGAPRTGNRAFADDYSRMVEDTWHIINGTSTICIWVKLPGAALTRHGQKAAACCYCRSGPSHAGWQTCRLQAAWSQSAAAARRHAGVHLMTQL
jgi:Lipase (class 3)